MELMDALMQARMDAYDDMMRQGCTCQPGRDHDGSEFGPCSYCEAVEHQERVYASLAEGEVKAAPIVQPIREEP